jgi:Amt family ammonium transporter
MGAIAGFVCAFACSKIKATFGYDDALDAFGVHGVGGTLGAILTGVFATRAAWDIGSLVEGKGAGTKLGLIEGGTVIYGQLAAVAVTWIFSIVVTFIILKVVDALVGLRVTPEEETRGLDVTQHEEEGYIFV